jgi:hypothetical protein
MVLLAVYSAGAQAPPPTEYQIKAAFIYNFAKFTDWPADAFRDAKAPFVLGILGENPFGNDLDRTLTGKTIAEHPMTIQIFRAAAEATNCHLLFINRTEKENLPDILKTVRGSSIMTVSEMDQFIEAGGMINFIEVANKIRFQINDDAAKSAHLKISSRLLGLAVTSPR